MPLVLTLPQMGEKQKWKICAQLSETEMEQLVRMLEENRGEFAFSLEELGGYNK